jgi:hypothetical protein
MCEITWKNTVQAVKQAIYDNIIRRMHFAYWITNATNTCSEYVILMVFHDKSGFANAPKYYNIHTLLVLFRLKYESNNSGTAWKYKRSTKKVFR